jgi:hypothetical protein
MLLIFRRNLGDEESSAANYSEDIKNEDIKNAR